MRVFPEQLATQLKQPLKQSYLLLGNEPLLLNESMQTLLQAARQQGFDEKHHFEINAQTDWQAIFDCCQALSLFSARQIIVLSLPDNGLNTAMSKQLVELASLLHQDILLVVLGPRINKRQESAQWFKALTKNGLWVPCNTPDVRQLPRFIQQRCQQLNLQADHESIQMLAQSHEGNLLALAQSLEKLSLLYPDGQLTLVRLQESSSRHNHFTPFQLVDALLAGQAKRSQRVLTQLQGEGVEPIILLRTLQKELFQLNRIHEMGLEGKTLANIFEHLKVWQQRRPLLTGALQRLPRQRVTVLIQHLAQLEVEAKTSFDHDIWLGLRQFSIGMCGLPISPPPTHLP
ncbi:DNA polymerase III subunit delta [Thaumasiovibrio subtropicus]|uniref:DNA polymerase III subunit delta n=1 Tax=Thaumasiovibrio subtropicus TaxID=1891207 RepID=UPI000B34E3C2|nr:DNA polymerase III subunit delta [Thaumasiovibrio subtropicus]